MPPAGLNLGSVTGLQNQLTGVLLQHVLVNATSAAQLVAVGEVNSALGAILNASYAVTIERAGSNVSTPETQAITASISVHNLRSTDEWLGQRLNVSAEDS